MKIKYAICIFLCTPILTIAANNGIQEKFDTAYNAWRKHLRGSIPQELRFSSILPVSVYFESAEFKAIIDLGIPAIPYALEVMETDWRLIEFFSPVTKWEYNLERSGEPRRYRWTVPEYPHIVTTNHPPDARTMWQWWWQEGRFLTGEKFAALYPKWRGLKAAGKSREKEADSARLEIRNLGIPVIGYVVKVLDESPDFIPDFIYLTDAELPAEATAAQCRAWWEKNKTKFDLPTKPAKSSALQN